MPRGVSRSGPSGRPKTSADERFCSYVDQRGSDECWNFISYVAATGYGQFTGEPIPGRKRGKNWRAHVYAWVRVNGPVPDGLIICHTCDNRRCCNPSHLYAGTHAQNAADRCTRGRSGSYVRTEHHRRISAQANAVYPEEYKDELVARVVAGESQSQVARDTGIKQGVISQFCLSRGVFLGRGRRGKFVTKEQPGA